MRGVPLTSVGPIFCGTGVMKPGFKKTCVLAIVKLVCSPPFGSTKLISRTKQPPGERVRHAKVAKPPVPTAVKCPPMTAVAGRIGVVALD